MYNASAEETTEDNYEVGALKDVYCSRNRLYYVAQVRLYLAPDAASYMAPLLAPI